MTKTFDAIQITPSNIDYILDTGNLYMAMIDGKGYLHWCRAYRAGSTHRSKSGSGPFIKVQCFPPGDDCPNSDVITPADLRDDRYFRCIPNAN